VKRPPELFIIRKPPKREVKLRYLYDKRRESERKFPGVDIDAAHRKHG
jgi:hypothetical protein